MGRRQILETVEELATEIVEPLGIQLVDVELVNEGGCRFLRIYINKTDGVGLDDCETVSRQLDKRLDDEELLNFPYILEVSSPGLERKLKKDREYNIFAGKHIGIHTYTLVDGRKDFQGILRGLEEGKVLVEEPEGIVEIPKEQISKAQLIYMGDLD